MQLNAISARIGLTLRKLSFAFIANNNNYNEQKLFIYNLNDKFSFYNKTKSYF